MNGIFKVTAAVLLNASAVLPYSHPTRHDFALAANQRQVDAEIRTFTGTIVKNGDQFVLNDAQTHIFYQLDDQETARKFEDKKVTVTGTLDAVKDIIRIRSVVDASA